MFASFRTETDENTDRFKLMHVALENTREKCRHEIKAIELASNARLTACRDTVDSFTFKVEQFEKNFKFMKLAVDEAIKKAIVQVNTHMREELKRFEPTLKAVEDMNELK